MIENIKRIVNEHHTLIVVIIGVLVIYFIYWWFCCKDKPLVNKVKGGESCCRIVKLSNNKFYQCIGMKISYLLKTKYKDTDAYTFYVVNQKGIDFIKNNKKLLNRFDAFVSIFLDGSRTLNKVIHNPYKTITGLKTQNRTFHQVLGTNRDNLIYKNSPPSLSSYTSAPPESTFSFEKYVQLGQKNNNLILDNYKKLQSFLYENAGNLIDKVVYIGQPSRTSISSSTARYSSYIVWSEKLDMIFKRKEQSIYKTCDDEIRQWYEKNTRMLKLIKYCYYDDQNGIIKFHGIDGQCANLHDYTGKPQTFQIADIYPAAKVIMMLFLLVLLYPNYGGDLQDYLKMLASYMIYTNLFNSFCGVKMNNSWNESIGNRYVYQFEKINGRADMGEPIINKNILTVLEMKLMKKHAIKLNITCALTVELQNTMIDKFKLLNEKCKSTKNQITKKEIKILEQAKKILEKHSGEIDVPNEEEETDDSEDLKSDDSNDNNDDDDKKKKTKPKKTRTMIKKKKRKTKKSRGDNEDQINFIQRHDDDDDDDDDGGGGLTRRRGRGRQSASSSAQRGRQSTSSSARRRTSNIDITKSTIDLIQHILLCYPEYIDNFISQMESYKNDYTENQNHNITIEEEELNEIQKNNKCLESEKQEKFQSSLNSIKQQQLKLIDNFKKDSAKLTDKNKILKLEKETNDNKLKLQHENLINSIKKRSEFIDSLYIKYSDECKKIQHKSEQQKIEEMADKNSFDSSMAKLNYIYNQYKTKNGYNEEKMFEETTENRIKESQNLAPYLYADDFKQMTNTINRILKLFHNNFQKEFQFENLELIKSRKRIEQEIQQLKSKLVEEYENRHQQLEQKKQNREKYLNFIYNDWHQLINDELNRELSINVCDFNAKCWELNLTKCKDEIEKVKQLNQEEILKIKNSFDEIHQRINNDTQQLKSKLVEEYENRHQQLEEEKESFSALYDNILDEFDKLLSNDEQFNGEMQQLKENKQYLEEQFNKDIQQLKENKQYLEEQFNKDMQQLKENKQYLEEQFNKDIQQLKENEQYLEEQRMILEQTKANICEKIKRFNNDSDVLKKALLENFQTMSTITEDIQKNITELKQLIDSLDSDSENCAEYTMFSKMYAEIDAEFKHINDTIHNDEYINDLINSLALENDEIENLLIDFQIDEFIKSELEKHQLASAETYQPTSAEKINQYNFNQNSLNEEEEIFIDQQSSPENDF